MQARDGKASEPRASGVFEEISERVRHRISRLPIRYRHFLELSLLEGHSQREICAELQIQPATYRALRRLALTALRASLRGDTK